MNICEEINEIANFLQKLNFFVEHKKDKKSEIKIKKSHQTCLLHIPIFYRTRSDKTVFL